MSLKQSVVIVNQFTVKTGSGSGSRGGTPGDYVLRYMARDKAVEDLTPVKLTETEDFITRYMARKEAVETLDSIPEIKQSMRAAQGQGGIAFGFGDVSLSHEKLMAASREIQELFDNGKTVMKTVLSFTPAYLKQWGLVDSEFNCKRAGDYRGNLDQMKLRMAVMHGLGNLKRDFDDLQYVGVIQVDTKHVHCHLAMVDRGTGRLAEDGNQKGKLSERMKAKVRRGIDMFLDEHVQLKQMCSNINQDKRNALCYIKKFTHKTMERQGVPQFLLACLPDNKNLWRAGTNSKEMKKPNYIVREYVTQVLALPDSGYKEALRRLDESVKRRQKMDGFPEKDRRRMYKSGQEEIIQKCMNGVYDVLKKVPDKRRTVRTPMMTAMAQSYEDVSTDLGSDPVVEFGFKLRSYSTRLAFHKKETARYHTAVAEHEKNPDITQDAKPLLDFLRYEEEYNTKLMSKYHHFLKFLPGDSSFEDDFEKIGRHKRRMNRLAKLKADPICKRMTPAHAEEYGRKVYETRGGEYAVTSPSILEQRYIIMEHDHEQMKKDFQLKLAMSGLSLETKYEESQELAVSKKTPYEFDDVKMLDIHHLSFDFPGDIQVGKPNVDRFVAEAEKRHALYKQARAYLEQSGQDDRVSSLPCRDVELMKSLAERISTTSVLLSAKPIGAVSKTGRTVQLNAVLDEDFKRDIKNIVSLDVSNSLLLDSLDK